MRFHISLRAAGPCETWMNGRKFGSDTIPKRCGNSADARFWYHHLLSFSAYDFMRIHIPRLAIDELAGRRRRPFRGPSHLRGPFFSESRLDSVLFQLATGGAIST